MRMSAIQNDSEMTAHFERKVAEGKNKMNVINTVRNKLFTGVLLSSKTYVNMRIAILESAHNPRKNYRKNVC